MRVLRLTLLALLAVYWLAIFALTHLPAPNLPHADVNDKVQHLLAYGVLGGLLYVTLWAHRPEARHAWLIVTVVAMAYGAVDEWLQLLVGRDCSLADWLADVAGAFLAAAGLAVLRLVLWHRLISRQKDAWRVREHVKARLAGDVA